MLSRVEISKFVVSDHLKLICRAVYALNRFSKQLVWNYPGCMEFPGLYGIYRLALSQSNFLRPGLYELVM